MTSVAHLNASAHSNASTKCSTDGGRGLSGHRLRLAGGPGLEPGPTESESVVLPLNYPPTGRGRRSKPASPRAVRLRRAAYLDHPAPAFQAPHPGKAGLGAADHAAHDPLLLYP